MLITHDLGSSPRWRTTSVMYAAACEKGTAKESVLSPAIPTPWAHASNPSSTGSDRLFSIPGSCPTRINMPDYCTSGPVAPALRPVQGAYPGEAALTATP
jgi:ABC-type dipeptide/oligopeptide/nickel transport system ATPase component